MIGRLTGRVVAQESEGVIVVDVGGVGYELFVPSGSAGRATVDGAERATFYVHTNVREDQIALYGFASELERFVFRTLIGVPNVGPKSALAVLSAMPASELAQAIAGKDVRKLTSVPGIGKKTAEMMVVQLRDKLAAAHGLAPPPGAAARTPSRQVDLVVSALTHMGFRPAEAQRAIEALGDRVESVPIGELVRDAIALLSK